MPAHWAVPGLMDVILGLLMPAVETDFTEAVPARQSDRVMVHIQADAADLVVVCSPLGRFPGASAVGLRLRSIVTPRVISPELCLCLLL